MDDQSLGIPACTFVRRGKNRVEAREHVVLHYLPNNFLLSYSATPSRDILRTIRTCPKYSGDAKETSDPTQLLRYSGYESCSVILHISLQYATIHKGHKAGDTGTSVCIWL